jgi:hypothetical protein
MSDQRSALQEVITKLKQERDELALKMHLAGMEAKDEYERISGKVDQLTDQFEPVKSVMEESAENLLAALGLAAGELKVGFQRLRKAIREQE